MSWKGKRQSFFCDICLKRVTKNGFKNHRRHHFGKGLAQNQSSKSSNFRCVVCQDRFKTEGALLLHWRFHKKRNGRYKFSCLNCSKKFKHIFYLVRHRELHKIKEAKQRFPCSKCEKVCLSKGALESHKNSHEDELIPCPFCDLKFRALGVHVSRFHENKFGEIVFKRLKKSQSRNYKRKKRKSSHSKLYRRKGTVLKSTQSKPLGGGCFICKICSAQFNKSTKLHVHIKKHWASEYLPYSCTDCSNRFYKRESLIRHDRDFH